MNCAGCQLHDVTLQHSLTDPGEAENNIVALPKSPELLLLSPLNN